MSHQQEIPDQPNKIYSTNQYSKPNYPNKFQHQNEKQIEDSNSNSRRQDTNKEHFQKQKIFEDPKTPIERLLQPHTQQQNQFYQQQSTQFAQQPCIYHQNQTITNFCQDDGCFLPLCPDCINQHIQFHQAQSSYPKIEKIDSVQSNCSQKVTDLMVNMHQNHNDVSQILKNYERDQIQIVNEKIILDLINNYFDKLQIEIHGKLKKQQEQNIDELETANRFITQKISDMQNLQYKLNGDKSLKYIVRLMSSNFLEQMESFNKDCKTFLINFEHVKLLDIETNESALYQINLELSKFIKAKNSAVQPAQEIPLEQQKTQYPNIFHDNMITSPHSRQDYIPQQQTPYNQRTQNYMIPISNQDDPPQNHQQYQIYQQNRYPYSNFGHPTQEYYQPNIYYGKGNITQSHVM